jgi:hypothetical protein
MELTQEHIQEIKKIASGIECSKDFRCHKSGLEGLCKARDIGLERYVECLGDEPHSCEFSLSFGRGYLCTCPVRIYIAKNLGR